MRSTSGISESACHTMCGFLPVTCSSATAASRSQLEAGKTTTAAFIASLGVGRRLGWSLGLRPTDGHTLGRRPHPAQRSEQHQVFLNLRLLVGQLPPEGASKKTCQLLQLREAEVPRHDMSLE